MEFKALQINDPLWDEVVKSSATFDFYHTRGYHQLEKAGESILLVASRYDDFIAIPLIVRPIPDTTLFDCTSAYGYCGPLSSAPYEQLNDALVVFFQTSVKQYFLQQNIIAAFSRLHPLISFAALENLGTVRHVNQTVAIDLRQSPEEQYRQYRKSNKSEINQLRRNGYEVTEASTDDDIRAFADIYNETMSRVNASQYYFFSIEYFNSFLKSDGYESRLLLARKDGRVAAGAIFTYSGSIIQYHLAGTTADFIRDTPMKLILDEARRSAPANFEFLHLGGGVGGSDSDSLFRFKSGFSDFRCMFSTWQFIADQAKYDELVERQNPDRESKFFPLYRAAALKDV